MDNILEAIKAGKTFILACPSGYFEIDADETRDAVIDANGNCHLDGCVIIFGSDGQVCITIDGDSR